MSFTWKQGAPKVAFITGGSSGMALKLHVCWHEKGAVLPLSSIAGLVSN